MSKIKFRAFDTEEKKMLDNVNPIFSETGELDFLLIDHSFYGYDMCELEIKSIYSSMLHDNFNIPVELMQYTGLKDKNGVKIYVGDVVEYIHGCQFEVVFKEYSFGWIEDGFIPFTNMAKSEFKKFEVIGNIYENLNLLKDQMIILGNGKVVRMEFWELRLKLAEIARASPHSYDEVQTAYINLIKRGVQSDEALRILKDGLYYEFVYMCDAGYTTDYNDLIKSIKELGRGNRIIDKIKLLIKRMLKRMTQKTLASVDF